MITSQYTKLIISIDLNTRNLFNSNYIKVFKVEETHAILVQHRGIMWLYFKYSLPKYFLNDCHV
jgi:hypothetical protein